MSTKKELRAEIERLRTDRDWFMEQWNDLYDKNVARLQAEARKQNDAPVTWKHQVSQIGYKGPKYVTTNFYRVLNGEKRNVGTTTWPLTTKQDADIKARKLAEGLLAHAGEPGRVQFYGEEPHVLDEQIWAKTS